MKISGLGLTTNESGERRATYDLRPGGFGFAQPPIQVIKFSPALPSVALVWHGALQDQFWTAPNP
jgi:hypothetical protein